MDPQNADALVGSDAVSYWRNVDMYVGGSEHAVGHLLYSRFWNKFLFDIGVAMDEEPFKALRNQGMILASDGRKMSKRWGNTVTPDEMIERFGSDSFRMYECFIGPFDASQPWIIDSLVGCSRFCERTWRLTQKTIEKQSKTTSQQELSTLHKTIKKVSSDIENFKFNTAVSSLMECITVLDRAENLSLDDCISFLKLVSVFAPYVTDELYQQVKTNRSEFASIHQTSWPQYNPDFCIDETVSMALQVNGKLRGSFSVKTNASNDEVLAIVSTMPEYEKWTTGKTIQKNIIIPNKIINVIVLD
jgi:leucyl-tRNA synthetase